MKQHERLARATLDTLPMNIAVLDGDGTILFTNRAWQDYGEEQSTDAEEFTGQNYFAGIDRTSDSHAAQAVDGIESVMAGEQSLFTLEYPCDTPEESQWFLMRVVPLAEGDGDEVVVAHIDITERKLAELRAEERAQQLQAERQRLDRLLRRINGLVHDTVEALMAAETREQVEQTLSDRFAGAEPFVAAWVGEPDLTTGELRSVAATGCSPADAAVDLEDCTDPIARAADTREVQVVETAADIGASSVHTQVCPDAEGLIAVPLVAGDTLYGVLTVYAGTANAVDDRETVVFDALGRMAATAIDAIERKRTLTADDLVELELQIKGHEGFVFDLSVSADCPLQYAGSVRTDGETYLMFFTAETDDASTILAAASDHPDIRSATHVSDFDGQAFFEFEVVDPPIVTALADFGIETSRAVVEDGTARVTAEVAADADVRSVVDELGTRFEAVELLAYRERERPTRTKAEFVSNLMNELTDRQRTAVQKAFVGGFFEWPRGTSGEDLAASMDISPSTYHQHLRAAQRKVFTEIFDR
jgi:predicted DNA binding protein